MFVKIGNSEFDTTIAWLGLIMRKGWLSKGGSSTKATDVDAAVGFSDRTRRGENIEQHANSSTGIFKYQEHLLSLAYAPISRRRDASHDVTRMHASIGPCQIPSCVQNNSSCIATLGYLKKKKIGAFLSAKCDEFCILSSKRLSSTMKLKIKINNNNYYYW